MADRIPPHSLPAEAALLGAAMISLPAIDQATAAGITATDFYRPSHGALWTTITSLHTTGAAVDHVTVADRIGDEILTALGGMDTLIQMTIDAPTIRGAVTYAEQVMSHAVRRRVIAAGAEIVAAGYDAVDGDEACAAASALLGRAVDRTSSSDLVPLSDAVDRVLKRWEDIEAGTATGGQLTGIKPLDAHLGGLRDGTLCVVGARTGAGKTSFGLSAAYHMARAGRPVLISSLEMSAEELAQRQLLALARATDPTRDMTHNQRAEMWRKLQDRARDMSDTDIMIDERPDVTVHSIRAQAAAVKAAKGDLGLVVVDYLQLVRPGDSERRDLEVAEVTRGLKLLAREVACPVLALSQLSRRVDQTTGKDRLPKLSDLRESGSIEQDSDVVILLHRPPVSRAVAPGSMRAEDVVEPEKITLIVAKNRFGPSGAFDALWYPGWALITAVTSTALGDASRTAMSDMVDARLPYRD